MAGLSTRQCKKIEIFIIINYQQLIDFFRRESIFAGNLALNKSKLPPTTYSVLSPFHIFSFKARI